MNYQPAADFPGGEGGGETYNPGSDFMNSGIGSQRKV